MTKSPYFTLIVCLIDRAPHKLSKTTLIAVIGRLDGKILHTVMVQVLGAWCVGVEYEVMCVVSKQKIEDAHPIEHLQSTQNIKSKTLRIAYDMIAC